jgi:hypothetical protein
MVCSSNANNFSPLSKNKGGYVIVTVTGINVHTEINPTDYIYLQNGLNGVATFIYIGKCS